MSQLNLFDAAKLIEFKFESEYDRIINKIYHIDHNFLFMKKAIIKSIGLKNYDTYLSDLYKSLRAHGVQEREKDSTDFSPKEPCISFRNGAIYYRSLKQAGPIICKEMIPVEIFNLEVIKW